MKGCYIKLSLCNRRPNHISDKQKKRRELLAKIGVPVHMSRKVFKFLSVTANEQIVLLPGDTHLNIFLKISV